MMKKYNSYKETGYDWLSKVPNNWKKVRLSSITKKSEARNGERTDLQVLSVYRDYGIIPKDSRNDNHNVTSLDLSNYKHVIVGDLVINKMKLWQGSLGVSNYEGLVSPAYIVCHLDQNMAISEYIHMLLRSYKFKTFYNRISKGVRVGQWDASYDDFKLLNLYLPSNEEQNQIIAYLNWRVSEVNKLIHSFEQETGLLREYCNSEIFNLVTKNRSKDLVPCEIDWIEMTPSSWSNYYLFQVAKERKESNKYVHHQNLLSLSYGKIINKDINTTDGLLPASFDNYQIIAPNTLVLRLTDLQNDKKSLRVGLSKQTGIITSAYIALDFSVNVDADYMYYWFHSLDLCKMFYGMGGGVRQSLNYASLRNMKLRLPNTKEEMVEIAKKCNQITQKADLAIQSLKEKIDYLKEYKQRLISDVATGEIDVRNVVIPQYEQVDDVAVEDFDSESEDAIEEEGGEE